MHTLITDGKLKRLPPKDPGSLLYVAMLLKEYKDWTRTAGPLGGVITATALTGKALRLKI
jgi:hypothetical protein